MSREGRASPPERIELNNDTLVIDRVFCQEVLAGASRRTAKNLERQGLAFVMVAGHKYRPLREGKAFVEARIQRLGQAPKRRGRR
jgi:hypothetical protein